MLLWGNLLGSGGLVQPVRVCAGYSARQVVSESRGGQPRESSSLSSGIFKQHKDSGARLRVGA